MTLQQEQHAKALFASICASPDPEAAVGSLASFALRDLNAWLAREGAVSGIPSMIHGLILCEAARRYLAGQPSDEGGFHD